MACRQEIAELLHPKFKKRRPKLRGAFLIANSWERILVHSAHAAGPPGPPPAPAAALSSSLMSATNASVVSIKPAIDAAFCSARRVTLAGSITPALTRSPYSPVSALKPKFSSLDSRILPMTTAPSWPALSAIWRSGLFERALHDVDANGSSPSAA